MTGRCPSGLHRGTRGCGCGSPSVVLGDGPLVNRMIPADFRSDEEFSEALATLVKVYGGTA